MNIKEAVKNIFWIIFLLSIVYIIYQILIAVLGGSWQTENIIVSGIGIIITGTFTIVAFMFNQSRTLGRLEERTKNFENRLSKLEDRFSNVEDRLSKVENKLQNVV